MLGCFFLPWAWAKVGKVINSIRIRIDREKKDMVTPLAAKNRPIAGHYGQGNKVCPWLGKSFRK
jgi:hypothetical protein